MPSFSDPSSLEAGHLFGHYKILSKLGQGGMGAVYKVADSKLQRFAALKVLIPKDSEPNILERFTKEIQLASSLRHPYIVPVYEYGEIQEIPYYTMQFIEGIHLRDYVENHGKFGEKKALEILGKISQALEYAHNQGIIHRDIKPENIMLDENLNPHLMDFGLARRINAKETRLTQAGYVVGSPEFMAPEQAIGKENIGYEADIYSLGSVMYFMLTGRAPFQNKDIVQLLRMVVEKKPRSLRTLNPLSSREMELVAEKCLEKDPKDRYPTIGMLSYDLKALLRGDPILARPLSPLEKTKRWVAKHKWIVLSIVLSCLCLVAVLLVWIQIQKEEEAAKERQKISRILQQSRELLRHCLSPEELQKKYGLLSGNPEENFSSAVEEEIEISLKKYLEIKGLLEQAYALKKDSTALRDQIIHLEMNMGEMAILGRHWLIAQMAFERCKELGKRKEGNELLRHLSDLKKEKEKKEVARVQEILQKFYNSPVSAEMKDEYLIEILKMKSGIALLPALLSYLQSPSLWQRLFAIETLGKIGNRDSLLENKTVGQWLRERLMALQLEKDMDELEALVWALGRLKDGPSTKLVWQLRIRAGEGSSFVRRTSIPFSWLPAEGKRENISLPALYERALQKHNQRLYREALEDWNQILSQQPNHANSLIHRGITYICLGDYSHALEDFNKTLTIDPRNAQAYENRGYAKKKLKDPKGAFQDLSKAIELDPSISSAYNTRGILHYDAGNYAKALQDFNSAIELDPNKEDHYIHRGAIYRALREYQKSIADYSRALKLNPKSHSCYNNRGNVYMDMGYYEDSIADFNKAIDLDPTYAGAYTNRGVAYQKKKNFEAALADFNRAIQINPKYYFSYFHRGGLYFLQGKYAEALQDYNTTLQYHSRNMLAYQNRGVVYYYLNRFDKAIEDFNTAIQLSPRNSTNYFYRAHAFEKLEQYEKMVEDFSTFLRLNPKDPGRKQIEAKIKQYRRN